MPFAFFDAFEPRASASGFLKRINRFQVSAAAPVPLKRETFSLLDRPENVTQVARFALD